MKKVAKSLVAATLLTSTLPTGFTANAEEAKTVQTEQLIIKFKEDASLSKEEKKELNIKTSQSIDDVDLVEVSVKDAENVIEKLEASEDVEFVTENTSYSLAEEATTTANKNDTYYDKQWNLKAINSEEAWAELPEDAEATTVAVLDTGIAMNHEDLKNRVIEGKTFLEGQDEDGVVGAEDDQGHGTFVSGIIAAESNNEAGISGVAGEADVKILPVKVMNKAGVGDAYHIAKGIDYAVSQNVDVINMSLSGEYNELVEDAVKKANAAGVVVVAAAGNGGGNADASFPAALDNVISVGSVTEKDQAYAGSNEGATVDLVAPGVNVVSTALAGDLGSSATSRYTTGSGTSYAAPHVAAVAALYKAKNESATPALVENVLIKSAKDLGVEGHDNKTGYGRVDAAAALDDDVLSDKSTFTAPRKNANVIGVIPLEVAVIDKEIKQMEFFLNGNSIGIVDVVNSKAISTLNTEKYEDGKYTITAKEVTTPVSGESTVASKPYEIKTTVTIRNNATSGYMFNVKAPNNSIAKGATVQLFEKTDDKYKEVWSGATDANGVSRVPSNVGTDLKDLKVVVQGKFTPEGKEESAFIYSRDVSTTGTVELKSDSTVPVELTTASKNGKELASQYFITLKDQSGIAVNEMKLINSANGSTTTTLYADKGMYNLFAYAKDSSDTYFLTETNTNIKAASSIIFDAANAGEVAVDNTNNALENAVLYLYNDDMNEALGSGSIATGANFYVTPGEYNYMVDAEVKGEANEENWVYILANKENKKAVVKKGEKTAIKAGGQIEVTTFKGDQEAIKRYAKQRSVKYTEREGEMDAYKSDQAFYTTEVFSDQYSNELVGMHRGTLAGQVDAINKKDVTTGETSSATSTEDWQVVTKDFGDIYAKFTVTRKASGTTTEKLLLDSEAKNATNPANRMYYMYSFFVMTSADYVKGDYDINLSMSKNPLMENGIDKTITMHLLDEGTNLILKDGEGKAVSTYVWLNRAEKTADGDIEWTTLLNRNSDATKVVSIPNNLQTSEIKNGNMAIIRYVVNGRYAYIYKTFDKLEQLNEVTIPSNMQEVKISEMDGSNKLDNIGTKLLMFKKPITIDGVEAYATVNNLQNYKYDSVYLEPSEDEYVIEGNYVSLSNGTAGKDNYYFLEPYKVEEKENNTVIFDKSKLAKIDIDADSKGFSDVRGAIVYPYNKYTDTFTTTLRTGKNFYVPANLEMHLQVQLGLGDTESNDKVWNYFMSKGEQTFTEGQNITWKVGGELNTNVKLNSSKVKMGTELSGATSIKDSYNNQLSSIIVNTTNDYTTNSEDTSQLAYKLGADGQVHAIMQQINNYSISHSVPAAAANSVKPVVSILDAKNKVVSKLSSLNFYAHLHDVIAPTVAGDYKVQLQIAGSPVKAVASETSFTVEEKTPIITVIKPTITSVVADNATKITGKTTANANVTVKNGSKVIGKGKANAKGIYSISIAKQKAGTTIKIVATIGKTSSVAMSAKVLDKTAPKIVSVRAANNTTKVAVKTEKGATIRLTVGKKSYTKVANSAGNYTFIIKKVKAGTKWTVKVTDKAGMSASKSGVVLDKIAPKVVKLSTKITTSTTKISGVAEANSKVVVYRNGKLYKTVKATSKGKFKVVIAKQKKSTVLSFVSKDAAGNKSKTKKVTVK